MLGHASCATNARCAPGTITRLRDQSNSCPRTPTRQGLDTRNKLLGEPLSYVVTSSTLLLCTQNNLTIAFKTCEQSWDFNLAPRALLPGGMDRYNDQPGRPKARSLPKKSTERKVKRPLSAARVWRSAEPQLARWWPAFAVQDSGSQKRGGETSILSMPANTLHPRNNTPKAA